MGSKQADANPEAHAGEYLIDGPVPHDDAVVGGTS